MTLQTLIFAVLILTDRRRLLVPAIGRRGTFVFDALMYLFLAVQLSTDAIPLACIAVVMAAINVRRCTHLFLSKKGKQHEDASH